MIDILLAMSDGSKRKVRADVLGGLAIHREATRALGDKTVWHVLTLVSAGRSLRTGKRADLLRMRLELLEMPIDWTKVQTMADLEGHTRRMADIFGLD